MRETILDRLVLGVILAGASFIGTLGAVLIAMQVGAGPDQTMQAVIGFCGSAIALAIAAPSRKAKPDSKGAYE